MTPVSWTTITLTQQSDQSHAPLSREVARQMIKDAGTKPKRVYHSPADPGWAAGFYWSIPGGCITVVRHRGLI